MEGVGWENGGLRRSAVAPAMQGPADLGMGKRGISDISYPNLFVPRLSVLWASLTLTPGTKRWVTKRLGYETSGTPNAMH